MAAAFRISQPHSSLSFRVPLRLASSLPFLGSATPGSLFDCRPSAPQFLIGPKRYAPRPEFIVPTCPGNFMQFPNDGLRIGCPNAQVVGNFEIGTGDRIESEGVAPLAVAVDRQQFGLTRQPAVDPAGCRLAWYKPTPALVAPSRSRKFLPKSFDSHPVIRKVRQGTGRILFLQRRLMLGFLHGRAVNGVGFAEKRPTGPDGSHAIQNASASRLKVARRGTRISRMWQFRSSRLSGSKFGVVSVRTLFADGAALTNWLDDEALDALKLLLGGFPVASKAPKVS